MCLHGKKVKHWRNIIDIFSFLRVLQVKERFLAQPAKEEKATTLPFTTLCAFFPSRANGFTFLDSLYNISFSTTQMVPPNKFLLMFPLGPQHILCCFNFLKIPNYIIQISFLSINKLFNNMKYCFQISYMEILYWKKKQSKVIFLLRKLFYFYMGYDSLMG